MDRNDDRDDMQEPGLSLTLNYGGKSDLSIGNRPRRPNAGLFKLEISSSTATSVEPSLTLGLPGDGGCGSSKAETEGIGKGCCSVRRGVDGRQSSPHSMISSFSGGRLSKIKGENDEGSDEAEKVSWGIRDEEELDGAARKKLRLTKEQSALLEDRFKEHTTLNPKQKQALARQLNLRPRQVEVWFQNRRARTKLKKTEVECEFLRKCCETLKEDNRRLQKELQELRSLKHSAPRYMLQPTAAAAAFTMCPSCKKITSGSDDGDESGSLVVAPKSRFFNPFAHSAAY